MCPINQKAKSQEISALLGSQTGRKKPHIKKRCRKKEPVEKKNNMTAISVMRSAVGENKARLACGDLFSL